MPTIFETFKTAPSSLTLVQALKKYVMLPNETNADLIKQLKELSEDDRAWYRAEFEKMGITIVNAAGQVVSAA